MGAFYRPVIVACWLLTGSFRRCAWLILSGMAALPDCGYSVHRDWPTGATVHPHAGSLPGLVLSESCRTNHIRTMAGLLSLARNRDDEFRQEWEDREDA